MAYIKFKELTKYFDFKEEKELSELPDYTTDYVNKGEKILKAYKNSKDYCLFTEQRLILFDKDPTGIYYKKIHIIPYDSISTSAINFKPTKVELLFSLDSGYQMHINFVDMNDKKKVDIKEVYKFMMNHRK